MIWAILTSNRTAPTLIVKVLQRNRTNRRPPSPFLSPSLSLPPLVLPPLLSHLYLCQIYFKELAHVIMEADKSQICNQHAGDPEELVV